MTTAQAESTLNANAATEFDTDDEDLPDREVKAEIEILHEQEVETNPRGLDYACHAVDFSTCTPDELRDLTASDDPQRAWPEGAEVPALSAGSFRMSTNAAKGILQDSVRRLKHQFQADCMKKEEREKQVKRLREMDPTQSMVYEWTKVWIDKRKNWKFGQLPPDYENDKHQLIVLGTAGTGKTTTVRAAVAEVRMDAQHFDAAIMVAHTGVAANNMGIGSTTVDTFFKLGGENKDVDLTSEKADVFTEMVRYARMLVIDEISMINPEQFCMMHRRLEQAAKQIFREMNPGQQVPHSFGGFGGLMVIVVGDFGQIPPVRAESLMMPMLNPEAKKAKAQRDSRALEGKRYFANIRRVVQLRRIYRQKEKDDFFDSNMNLRDGIVTQEHYELWKEHEIGVEETEPEWSTSGKIMSHGLQLAFENEQVGKINARRLSNPLGGRCEPAEELPEDGGMPTLANARNAVLRADAYHGNSKHTNSKMDAYRNLRPVVHLQLMAPVMLTTNQLWDEFVVPLGLMNGARGRVVAVLYKSSNEKRSDGHTAPTGMPWEHGEWSTPLPDMVIVNFPGYRGEPFFNGLPKTWVPVPAQRQMNTNPRLGYRISIPLRLCWAMTCHKCQGITETHGIIIDYKTRTDRNPVAEPGVAFVANTRVVEYGIQGFRHLPSRMEFMHVRHHKKFRARETFECQAALKHDESMRELKRWNRDDEYKAHCIWWRMQKQNEDNKHMYQKGFTADQDLTEEEKRSLREMIFSTGMKPFPDAVLQGLRDEASKPAATLLQLMSAHKKKGNMAPLLFGVAKRKAEPRSSQVGKQDAAQQTIQKMYSEFLLQTGCVRTIQDAESIVGQCDELSGAYEYCQRRDPELGDELSDVNSLAYLDSERGLDAKQHKMLVTTAGKRRCQQSTRRKQLPIYTNEDTRVMYMTRMRQLLHGSEGVTVIDPGTQTVRGSINACFWLSLVAAWSQNQPHICDNDHKYYEIQKKVMDLAKTGVSWLTDGMLKG